MTLYILPCYLSVSQLCYSHITVANGVTAEQRKSQIVTRRARLLKRVGMNDDKDKGNKEHTTVRYTEKMTNANEMIMIMIIIM